MFCSAIQGARLDWAKLKGTDMSDVLASMFDLSLVQQVLHDAEG